MAVLSLGGCNLFEPKPAAPQTAADAALDRTLAFKVKQAVIYAENRSFTNLYGNYPGVQYPLSAVSASRYTQRDRDAVTPMPDAAKNLGRTGAAGSGDRASATRSPSSSFSICVTRRSRSSMRNGAPLPNSVITRDLVHRFYQNQNQMQINAGRNNQFAAWGDSGGLVMGHYLNSPDTLRLWDLAQQYTLCNNFFMSAFGGSWLNHIFLISAQALFYPDARNSPAAKLLAVVEGDDPAGSRLKLSPDSLKSALEGPPKFVRDGALTADGYAVNTIFPPFQPSNVRPTPARRSADSRSAAP